jgi:multidrug resistance efflux pump
VRAREEVVIEAAMEAAMTLIPYGTTLRALEADRRRAGVPVLIVALGLFGAWVAWAVGAEVPVNAESASAEVAPLLAARVLAAPADGVMESRSMQLGQRVRAGELLVTFDRREVVARRDALVARREAVALAAAALAAQQAAGREALAAERRAEAAAGGERERRAAEAAAAAALADEEGAREARLAAAGLLAPAAAARRRAEAAQRRAAAAAATLAVEAGRHRGGAALTDRTAAVARLGGELARARGELAALGAEIESAEREVELRVLRAPVAGRLAEVTPAQPGAAVGRGAPLATLVPEGLMGVVAYFESPGGGAIRAGQRARVRLAARPGGGPASFGATVTAVAAAAGAGGRREVRLALLGAAAMGSPLVEAGEPCEVEVELARQTPARLALGRLGLGVGPRRSGGEVAP